MYQYPDLNSLFTYWKTNFYRKKYHLKEDELEEIAFELLDRVEIEHSWFQNLKSKADTYGLLNVLYDIGFLGDFVLGGEGGSTTKYSFADIHEPILEEVDIHPCFRKSVGTVARIRKSK